MNTDQNILRRHLWDVMEWPFKYRWYRYGGFWEPNFHAGTKYAVEFAVYSVEV